MASSTKGWTRASFDRMAQNVTDRVDDPSEAGVEFYVGLEHLDPDSLKIRRWGAPTDVEATKLRFRRGDIIFGKRRVYQRKLAVADFDGICSAHAMVIRACPQVADPSFLPFFMQSDAFMERALEISVGSLSPTINWKTLASQEFDLPPLEEQRRLSATLVACDAARETLVDLGRAVRVTQSGLFERTFADTSRVARLADLLSQHIQYGSSTRANPERQGVPMLRIPNVLRGHLDLSDLKWVELPENEVDKYSVCEGDILIVRTNGNPDYVARGTTIPRFAERTVFASYLMRLTPDPSRISSSYLAGAIATPRMRRHLAASIRSSAGNFNINAQDLGKTEIPWPDIDQQRLLEERLMPMAEAEGSIGARSAGFDLVKNSLLERLKGVEEGA